MMRGKIKANNEKSSHSPLDTGIFFHISMTVIKRLFCARIDKSYAQQCSRVERRREEKANTAGREEEEERNHHRSQSTQRKNEISTTKGNRVRFERF